MAERIPGARLIEEPGAGHLAVGDVALRLIDEIGRFLTDVWDHGGWEPPEPDRRVLATVLFTDIAGSSEKAAALGDRRWRELLEPHHQLVRHQLLRFRGTEVDTAGDGFFSSFDGPAGDPVRVCDSRLDFGPRPSGACRSAHRRVRARRRQ